MLEDIGIAFWFLLPAALANAAPIFSAAIPGVKRWNAPLDSGKKFRGKEIFGANKTWRGLAAGIIVATITLWLQQLAVDLTSWGASLARSVNYADLPLLLLGPLFGIGALGADAVESFFKRLRNIPAGKAWFPFDQIDYVIGAILVSLPFVQLQVAVYAWMLGLWFSAHLIASYAGWLIGLKKAPI